MVKKIVLSRLSNIKTLSKKNFELYSERVPVILESIVNHFEQSMAKREEFESYLEQLFQYTRNFIETGDLLAALKLLTQVHETFESKLNKKTRLLITAAIAYLFAALGMDEEADHFLAESLKSSGAEITPCYVFNMTTQSMIALQRRNFNVAVSTSRRALNYLEKTKSGSPFSMRLPLSGPELRQRLTHIHTIASLELATTEQVGSGKRKTIFENALSSSRNLNAAGKKRHRFFYLCQQALICASMGYPSKSEDALEKAFHMLNANQDFLTAHGYYYYAARAVLHSYHSDFSSAYSDAKLAFRASFNTPDVFMELYVMDVFLDIAQTFSMSFPENRKNVSEFYMKGNSLLKQFVEFLEEKDWYTGKKHSHRVASLSYMIGKKMLTLFPYVQNQLDLQTLYLAAYVHDVGKLKLPWILINKIGKLSDIKKIFVRESLSVRAKRCIYPLVGYSRKGEGLERNFIADILDKSSEVESFGKIQERKHLLNISYRDKDGIKRDYFPDFVIKTKEKMYLVETKSEDEIQKAEGNEKSLIVLEAKAAISWCKTASKVILENQPQEWEYFILSEKTFEDNKQLSFDGIVSLGKLDTERLIASDVGKLF